MMDITVSVLMVLVNFILYLAFGSFFTKGRKGGRFSMTLTVLVGFFAYYSIFTLFCVPMMIKWWPLSWLAYTWAGAAAVICVLSLAFHWRVWGGWCRNMWTAVKKNPIFYALLAAIVLVQVIVVANAYNFTLDATYYVGNVSTSIRTNSMNIYDPFTGDWLDHFEMRYFFATYPMQDAVMCFLTGIHPLIQTKTIMSAVIYILSCIVIYKLARELWEDNLPAVLLMMIFAAFINYNFITIYTASNFLLTRTFEGKAVLGNVVLPAILYMYARLLRQHKDRREWFLLFLICFGSTTISSTSNMLVPAALSILLVPLAIMKRDWRVLPKYVGCMIPCIVMMLIYVLYVKGFFAIYTHPISGGVTSFMRLLR